MGKHETLDTTGATAAQSVRDEWLEEHKEIWPSLSNMVVGNTIRDTNNRIYPSSWVRAGDTLQVRDLIPESVDAGRDALRTFYIVETKYDVGKGTLAITPDTESSSLEAIIAQGGVVK